MLFTPRCLLVGVEAREQDAFIKAINALFDHADLKFSDNTFETFRWAEENKPDLVVVDESLIDINSDYLVGRLLKNAQEADTAVLITVDPYHYGEQDHIPYTGIIDYVRRPIHYPELLQRLRNVFSMIESHRRQQVSADIISAPQETMITISDSLLRSHCYEKETLLRLAKAGEYRDEVTGAHVARIGDYSRRIAEGLGLPELQCNLIELAAPLHDIGKIGVPDSLLLKPGRFSLREREDMKSHTTIGYEILKDSPSKYLQMGAEIALSHHEKFDGTGYPYGLKGDNIPLSARIVSVADVYDALTSTRPYKEPWSTEKALDYLDMNKGSAFDPDCVDAFVAESYMEISL